MRTPLLSAGVSNCRLGITRSHNCSAMRFEITNVWTSCRTAAGEFACSSWMTDSIGSNVTRSLYFMAPFLRLLCLARADRDNDGIGLLELVELRMPRLGIDQCAVSKAAVPRGNDCAVATRNLEQPQRFNLQGGIEQNLHVVQQ